MAPATPLPIVTRGLPPPISGLNRTIYVDGTQSVPGLIQTDAAISRGNSGGALVDSRGN